MRRGALVLFLVFLLVSCETEDPTALRPRRTPASSPASTRTRVIGLVGSMSGELDWRGQDAFEGADASVQALNRMLRQDEPMFELVTIDDQSEPQQARAAVEQLAANGQTVGIVYAGPEQILPELEQFLATTKVPVLFDFGDLYSSQLLTAHLFQMSPAYLWEARVLARYLTRDRRYGRIAALTSDSLSGASARRSLQIAFGELDRTLVDSQLIDVERSELVRTLRRLQRRRVQAIIVEGSPDATAAAFAALERLNARYTTTARAKRARPWAPQVAGFDTLISPQLDAALVPEGTVAADTYARGAHYLPIPSLSRYREVFNDWWGGEPEPIGWERRSFESVQLLGWAARRFPSTRDVDYAGMLHRVRSKRFGGLDVTFGPDDHTAVDQATVGLWVVPALRVPEQGQLPNELPWVPLARGFSIDGERTNVLNQDWKFLFRDPPPPKAPAPRFRKQKFGVTTPRSDPIH